MNSFYPERPLCLRRIAHSLGIFAYGLRPVGLAGKNGAAYMPSTPIQPSPYPSQVWQIIEAMVLPSEFAFSLS